MFERPTSPACWRSTTWWWTAPTRSRRSFSSTTRPCCCTSRWFMGRCCSGAARSRRFCRAVHVCAAFLRNPPSRTRRRPVRRPASWGRPPALSAAYRPRKRSRSFSTSARPLAAGSFSTMAWVVRLGSRRFPVIPTVRSAPRGRASRPVALRRTGLAARPRPGVTPLTAEIGIFGGSGFYEWLDGAEEVRVDTPYGTPSGHLAVADVAGRRVAFMPRHGPKHETPAPFANYRANVWAMRPAGTVVVVQGPRFSTRAESRWYSRMGWDIVGMTQYPEVILARELEMCYLNLCLVTDYDAGLEGAPEVGAVQAHDVMRVLAEN